VGHPLVVRVEASGTPIEARLELIALRNGTEQARYGVIFPPSPPYSASVAIENVCDTLVLTGGKTSDGKPVELARVAANLAEFEAEAKVRPEPVVNPVDLGTILVPSGWLLLGPDQLAWIEVAAFSRARAEPNVSFRAWFESSHKKVTTTVSLRRGELFRWGLRIPEWARRRDRDRLHLALRSASGVELWHKAIPVVIVQQPPRWPHFGATYTKLRYDAPISVRDPRTGTFSSLSYEEGWSKDLQDVVVSFPNGARFVFWRGSSYIPFWAGKYNTGACYEWAEVISRRPGAVDCVEPLMDKELRYGRVQIVESTPARVHVRWTYQSTDLNYKVWGDLAVEDYYFYPDGFGTRVLELKTDAATDYELSEFIILTPQGAYPLDVLPEQIVEAQSLDGKKSNFRMPFLPGNGADPRTSLKPPAMYRLHLSKEEPQSAIFFNPGERELPRVLFGPFFDRGLMVTPCYWGSHWPLARGNATGSKIDDRIALSPCHNSVMSWAGARPEPIWTAHHSSLDTLGRSRPMTMRRWAWLIGMSDANDQRLLQWAKSFMEPPSLEIKGARLPFDSYLPHRRGLRLLVEDRSVLLKIKPQVVWVNPVIEISGAPKGALTIKRNGSVLSPASYAWDGHVLWLNALIDAPVELNLTFAQQVRAGSFESP
jgi:hypothetical protein